MQANLDPVVAVVANDVVLNERFRSAIQVNTIVAVAFEDVIPDNSAASLEVDAVAGSGDDVVEDVELRVRQDAIRCPGSISAGY